MGFSVNRRDRLRSPRVCGENALPAKAAVTTLGSPPRVRGKGNLYLRQMRRNGITPACAGKSLISRSSRSQSKDHPRVCGEKTHCTRSSVDAQGSPPRVRGKACWLHPAGGFCRITPACAGKSAHIVAHRLAARDHPRVCGEKLDAVHVAHDHRGSPPRVRGKVHAAQPLRSCVGITPACAGKSSFFRA